MCTVIFAAATGCADTTGSGRPTPNGSSAITVDERLIQLASTDDGALVTVDRQSGEVTRLALGKEPVRLARAGDRLFVTLRGERALAVVKLADEPQVEARVATGAEPFGVVAAAGGDHVYVASSLSGRVDELDTTTLEVTRTWRIEGEPRWLAIHPGGGSLVVGSVLGSHWHSIDLETGSLERFALPRSWGMTFTSSVVSTVELASRVTGDPAFSPDGAQLFLPVLNSDVTTPLSDDPAALAPLAFGRLPGYYQYRFTAAVVNIPYDGGKPLPDRATTHTFGPLGAPSGVTVSPRSEYVLISFFNTTELVALVIAPRLDEERGSALTGGSDGGVSDASTSGTLAIPGRRPGLSAGAWVQSSVRIRGDLGVSGLAIGSGGEAYAYSPLLRSISRLDLFFVEAALFDEDPVLRTHAASTLSLGKRIVVTPPVLPAPVERGRLLFNTMNDGLIAGPFGGVACATCHLEGRTDGITWPFALGGPRQTPSLAGGVSQTLPLLWDGSEPSLLEEVVRTSQTRMGGTGLEAHDARAIAAYVDSIRPVDRDPELDLEAIQRGRAIFERPEVGCAGCHSGPRFTDQQIHQLPDLGPAKTRSLSGISATGPYLRDGSAATLLEVLERARDGSKGDTSELGPEELQDLETFLRSL